MKRLIFLAMFASLVGVAVAQDATAIGQERSRIAAQRSAAESRYSSEEKACYSQFSVSTCIGEARAHRRAELADLRRQEVSLNDIQRKRRGAERIRAVENKSDPTAKGHPQPLASGIARQERQATKSDPKAQAPTKSAPKPRASAAREDHNKPDSAENLKKYAERAQEAQLRKERAEKRQRDKAGAAAKTLPVPP